MNAFIEFLKSFCIVAIVSGMVLVILPSERFKKHIKLIISLCVVSSLISPVISFAKEVPKNIGNISFGDGDVKDAIYSEIYSDITSNTRDNLESEIEKLLCSRFGFEDKEVFIIVTLDTKNISAVNITDINVFLSDISKKDEIKSYLSELFLYSVNINIMKKGE